MNHNNVNVFQKPKLHIDHCCLCKLSGDIREDGETGRQMKSCVKMGGHLASCEASHTYLSEQVAKEGICGRGRKTDRSRNRAKKDFLEEEFPPGQHRD